jgi:alkylated DNA nucleotide flippase Atl1
VTIDTEVHNARILRLSTMVSRGHWTTYGVIGEVIFGTGKGAQTVRSVLRTEGSAECAHRTLRAGGRIGPEQSLERLRDEGCWDEANNRARPERFLDADALRRLESEHRRRV